MLFGKKIEELFRKKLLVRNDNKSGIRYDSPGDFPGLRARPYDFSSQLGHTLKGWFYHYDNPRPDCILVFDHGMGNGHRAYMKELERLAAGGFLVFAYDHTGCMASGGENIRGFTQSLADLDDCLKALKAEPALTGRGFRVMGHSWGGFSTMNIPALHPDITHVVSMSGFLSAKQVIRQSLTGFLALYRGTILRFERHQNPRYADYSAVDTLSRTDARVLLVYSRDDQTVSFRLHCEPLRRELNHRANIHFHILSGKNHNPTYTDEAVVYKNAFFSELKNLEKAGQLQTPEQRAACMDRWDFERMTDQDDAVWQVILNHLKSE